MSAIGNYIHLTAAGYNKTGTNKQREAPSIDAATALAIEKDSIKQRIDSYKNMNDLSSLEVEINHWLDVLGGRVEPMEGEIKREEIQRIVEEYLKEIYGDTLQTLDFNNLNVSYSSEKTKGVGRIKTNYWQYKNWKNTITQRIEELNHYMNTFIENKNAREFKDAMLRIESIKKDLYNGTYDLIAQNGWETNRQNPLKIAIKDLNVIIEKYAAMPALSAQKGDMLESTVAIIPEIAKGLAEQSIKEEFQKNIKGKNTLSVEINENYFQGKNWNMNLGDITQEGKVSQNKIDVSFDWEGQQLNISAKNVNLGEGRKFIHTVSGSSLLYLIQDEDSDFVNHYFNLFSNHPDKKGNMSGYASMRKAYFDTLKLVIAYKALTGDTFGRDNNLADVFIVNDSSGNKSPKVKVFSVADILKKFQERPTSNLGLQNTAAIQRLYANKRVNNCPSGIARVQAVLNEAHQRKISASFNSDILDWS